MDRHPSNDGPLIAWLEMRLNESGASLSSCGLRGAAALLCLGHYAGRSACGASGRAQSRSLLWEAALAFHSSAEIAAPTM